MNDVALNRKESIERCVRQIRTYYTLPSDKSFKKDHLKQDAIAANLQRTCGQCIDLANHVVKSKKLGLPKESKEGFKLLAQHGLIPSDLAKNLGKMIGFRNTLVHEYQKLDIELMVDVIENHLDELVDFSNYVLKVSDT